MSLILDWELPGGAVMKPFDLAMMLASAISNTAQKLVHEQLPDLEDAFPLNRNFQFHAHFDPTGWFALRLVFLPRLGAMVGPKMEEGDIVCLKSKLEPFEPRPPDALAAILGDAWLADNRFTYAGPYSGHKVSWKDIEIHLLSWLNSIVLPHVLEENRTRVLRAIPQPPVYDIEPIRNTVWVLECDRDSLQGSGFALKGVGLVTCNHVLGSATRAFRHDRPDITFPVTVIARHPTVDLAILSIATEMPAELERGSSSAIRQMDHILVAGHPNYRKGDSPVLVPGLVVGFRTQSSIRRFLTNAPIVAGMSGGPVVDRTGHVIGIAATGAERFNTVQETEDLGIIPVDALDLLLH